MRDLRGSDRREVGKMRRLAFLVAVTLAVLAVTPDVGAITDGQPDGDGHLMVGAVVYEIGDGVRDWGCSGSLLSSTVFLTAAHCVGGLVPGEDPLWVTFDPEFDANGTFVPAKTWVVHPEWNPIAIRNDVAVIVLAEEVELGEYAQLPDPGLLDEMKADKSLSRQLFTNVGYGCAVDRDVEPLALVCDGVRRLSASTYGSFSQ
jgi:hypothetical protein